MIASANDEPMTVVLSEETRALLEQEIASGFYATPDDAVNFILQQNLPSGIDHDALKESLRVAMKQTPIPYRKGMFAELAERVIAREKAT
jgi:Arc/MetJ-type ribon-helix-helix transcriptional regulator